MPRSTYAYLNTHTQTHPTPTPYTQHIHSTVLPSFYARVLQSPAAVSVALPASDEVNLQKKFDDVGFWGIDRGVLVG